MAAARAGAPTALIGAIGRDAFGEAMTAFLANETIDLSGLARVEAPTGIALIVVDEAGENSLVVVPGANATLDAARAEALDFAPGDVALASGETPVAFAEAAFRRARARGARTLFNPSPFDAASLRRMLPVTDALIVNARERADLAAARGLPPEPPALADGLGLALIATDGAAGATVVAGGRMAVLPAPKVVPVDTTGAGDCFAGYLAAGWADGKELSDAAREAVRAAALATTRHGAGSAMPRAAEVAAAFP